MNRPASADAPPAPFELVSLFRDPRFWRGPAVWVLLLFVGANALVTMFVGLRERQAGIARAAQGRLALDPKTANLPVRYDWSIGDRYEEFLHYIPDSRRTHLVVLSGMSQMYTINDYRPGDQTIADWMDDALAPKGTRVFGLASPNMNHQESLFVLMTAVAKPETKPDVYIFPVQFGQMREVDFRKQYLAYLRRHPELAAAWREVAQRYRAKYPQATRDMVATLAEVEKSDLVPDETSFESRVRKRVSAYVPLVRERRSLNSEFRLALFAIRNAVLGIKPTTKRPIVRQRYDVNREFLGLMADVGHEHGVTVIWYVPPLNPRGDSPYLPDEYDAFKQWLAGYAKEKQVPFANLENVVPSEDWGTFLQGPDFGHFRGAGHRKTAAALLRTFSMQLSPRGDSTI